MDFVLDGTLMTDGKEYATLKGVSSSFNGGKNPKVNFSNLSKFQHNDGDHGLAPHARIRSFLSFAGNGLNHLWNREPQGLLRAYKTAVDQLHPVLASTYSNLLFQNVPFEELFPAKAEKISIKTYRS